jgi:hypothetical protein
MFWLINQPSEAKQSVDTENFVGLANVEVPAGDCLPARGAAKLIFAANLILLIF